MSTVNQLSLSQSRALLAATKREGVTLTPDARQRIGAQADNLDALSKTSEGLAKAVRKHRAAKPKAGKSKGDTP